MQNFTTRSPQSFIVCSRPCNLCTTLMLFLQLVFVQRRRKLIKWGHIQVDCHFAPPQAIRMQKCVFGRQDGQGTLLSRRRKIFSPCHCAAYARAHQKYIKKFNLGNGQKTLLFLAHPLIFSLNLKMSHYITI